MRVSERDRDVFRRIAAAKAASHAEASARHMALSVDDRLRASWRLYLESRSATATPIDDDDPSPFYETAKARGLYRP